MEQKPVHKSDEEIDLAAISRRIKKSYHNFLLSIFKGILFLKRHAIALVALLVVGGGLGFLLDRSNVSYNSEIIVTPNFGTTDYLYTNIQLLNSKIADKDTAFFKRMGVAHPDELLKIEVKPIVDIYNFVNDSKNPKETYRNTQNFELVKLFSENGDINKIITDENISRNYPNHVIKIKTTKMVSFSGLVQPILAYLNNSKFYDDVRLTYLQNVKTKIAKNEEIIAQINKILDEFVLQDDRQKSEKLVYYNENSQLNDVIATKDNLTKELGTQRIELIAYDKVIKDKSRVLNIKENQGLNNKMKFVLPLLLLAIFILYRIFVSFYRNQSRKYSESLQS